MNITNLTHALLAVACQLAVATVLWLVGTDFTTACAMGGLLAVGFYWGREVTQAETKAGGTPWWGGFDFRQWTQDSIYDLAMPVGACLLLLGLAWVFC
jgi:hypothetical protein